MKTILTGWVLLGAMIASAAQVTDVQVKLLDGFGGDVGSVLSRCQTKVGDTYDPVTVTRDVNSLNGSGEFDAIDADAETKGDGVAVTFFIRRKMRYQAPMTVLGAQFYGESKISKESGLVDGYLYGESDLATAASKVRDLYLKKNFPYVKVGVKYAITDANNCTVTMTIDEGPRRKIGDYLFPGAVHVEASALKDAIGDYPWWNPIGWFSDEPVTAEQQAQCVAKIEEVFRNAGYLDVEVGAPERVEADATHDNVSFTIVEGPQYVVGKSSIAGVTRYSPEQVMEKSALPAAGAVAGAQTLEEAAHRVEVTVGSGDSGLADTHVEVQRIPSDAGTNVLDIVYKVTEGVPVVIDEVVIRGNDYTKDKVIRREIALGPGDRMLADRAERSQKRLENLNYFTRVRYYLEPTGRGKDANGCEYRNLVYEVEEKNTGSFMVGIGASSVDSVYISAEVSQSNFDLFAPGKWFRGAGQKGRAYVQWGPRIQTIEVSVTEPYFLDRMLEFTVEGYRRGRWYDEYDLYRSGAAATLSYPVKFWPTWDPFGRLGFRLSGEFINFDDVDSGTYEYNGQQDQYFERQDDSYGDAMQGVLRVFWSHNTTDNYRTPSTGGRSNVFGDLGGGDNSFWRLGVSHRQYFTVWQRFHHVLMIAGRAETVDAFSDDLPIYEKMFLGGPRSLRGIKYRNVSPLIRRYYSDDYAPIGGQTLFVMNFEYTVPIVKMLRLAVFSDLGSVGEDTFDLDFSDTFAWTIGVGVRLDIPMFPIRLDFATPIKKPDNAEEEVFSFTVGYDF